MLLLINLKLPGAVGPVLSDTVWSSGDLPDVWLYETLDLIMWPEAFWF